MPKSEVSETANYIIRGALMRHCSDPHCDCVYSVALSELGSLEARIAELEAALEEAKTIVADDRTLHSACSPTGCYMREHIDKFDELTATLATGPAPEQPVG